MEGPRPVFVVIDCPREARRNGESIKPGERDLVIRKLLEYFDGGPPTTPRRAGRRMKLPVA